MGSTKEFGYKMLGEAIKLIIISAMFLFLNGIFYSKTVWWSKVTDIIVIAATSITYFLILNVLLIFRRPIHINVELTNLKDDKNLTVLRDGGRQREDYSTIVVHVEIGEINSCWSKLALSFIKKRSIKLWICTEPQDICAYSFDKSFYYWLLKNSGQVLQINGKEMRLLEVKGFRSNSERNAHSYSGEGSNIGDEIPLKSIISMDEKLISLYIRILYNHVTYSFYLDHDGRISIFIPECGEHATENPRVIETEMLLLTIYFDIIPFLVQKNNISMESGWKQEEKVFKKGSAVEAILELMQQNDVSLSDLRQHLLQVSS